MDQRVATFGVDDEQLAAGLILQRKRTLAEADEVLELYWMSAVTNIRGVIEYSARSPTTVFVNDPAGRSIQFNEMFGSTASRHSDMRASRRGRPSIGRRPPPPTLADCRRSSTSTCTRRTSHPERGRAVAALGTEAFLRDALE
jgi:hypothetical protein